jgi:primosomal protein N' (replication factor Y)
VIVQTMMDHPIFNYTNEVDYIKFYEYELANRQTVGYPPILRLAEIELKNTNEVILEKEATQIAHDMSALIENSGTDITLLGPSKPPVSKIKNTHSRKLYIKSTSINHLIMLYKKIDKSRFKSSIFFTPNP